MHYGALDGLRTLSADDWFCLGIFAALIATGGTIAAANLIAALERWRRGECVLPEDNGRIPGDW